MTAGSSIGTNKPLLTLEEVLKAPDGAWHLWSQLATPQVNPHYSHFGNPSNFYSRVLESNWLSFTVTLKNPEFLERLEKWSGNKAGTGALVTFKDSNWLMSIVVPHQPHFLNQADGYGSLDFLPPMPYLRPAHPQRMPRHRLGQPQTFSYPGNETF
jgi:oleate hydratase